MKTDIGCFVCIICHQLFAADGRIIFFRVVLGSVHPYTTVLTRFISVFRYTVVVKECLGGRGDNTPETSVEQQVQSNVVPGDIVSPADREVRIDRSYLDAL